MTKTWKSIAVAGLALSLCCPADARDRHVLWTVAGKHNTVYLLGSIHVLRASDGGLPDVANAAYADAEKLVMEIDMDDALAQPEALAGTMQRTAMLPAGQTLHSVLGTDYPAVQKRAAEAGLDLAIVDGYAPWFVAVTLMAIELAKRGFSPEMGVEQTLAARATADHKPIVGLETPEQQFAVLGSLPLEQQKHFLLMTLEEVDEVDTELEQMLSAWKSGDTQRLESLLSEEFNEFPELYRPLTEDRNRAWLPKIEDMLDDDDDYLVVVGALHLVGHNSVIDLLEHAGYKVTQQ